MSLRIYVLNPPFKANFVRCGRWQGVTARGGTLYYPIWLAYATGILEQDGHKVRLVDAIARGWSEEQVAEDAERFSPDVVVVDSNFSSMGNDIEVANLLKEKTHSLSILVGPPVSQFPEQPLRAGLDIVIRSEFDLALRDVIQAVEAGRPLEEIDGISFRRGEEFVHNKNRALSTSQELDSMPFVSKAYKDHLDIHDYFLSNAFYPMVQIITSRGCPNQCTFCSWPETLTGRKFRARGVQNVVEEFAFINENMPEVKEIFLEDDSFTLDKKRVQDFCQQLIESGVTATWSCQSRATLNYDLMKLMKKAGCRLLIVGFESGSDQVLKNIKKGVTTDQLRRFNSDAKKARLKILADFVIGFQGENKETVQQTIDFIKEIRPDLLQVAVATPMPGTEFYNWCQANGFLQSDDMSDSIDSLGFQKCIVSYPWLNKDEIEKSVNRALKEYYMSPSYIPIAIKGVVNKNFLNEIRIMMRSTQEFMSNVR